MQFKDQTFDVLSVRSSLILSRGVGSYFKMLHWNSRNCKLRLFVLSFESKKSYWEIALHDVNGREVHMPFAHPNDQILLIFFSCLDN